jgi:hypothetical protein
VAIGIETNDGSFDDQAFQVEQRGIDYVPENERWATPRNIAALWAGTSINVEYFIYGALLMGFGFSFYTALWPSSSSAISRTSCSASPHSKVPKPERPPSPSRAHPLERADRAS